MKPVAIVGGGITGLSAAHRLSALGIPVTVYEAAPQVGGVIRSESCDGFLAEAGPNTILDTSPLIGGLVRELGLDRHRIDSSPEAKHRYILRNGRPQAVPGGVATFLRSPLFSFRTKLRLPLEMLVPRARAEGEESVAAFVNRRLGREFLDYAINPMVGGVYAGDPVRLSLRHAFPRLHEVERRYGSLILGRFLGAAARRKRGEIPKTRARKFSFTDGLQTLTDALALRLGKSIRTRSPVLNLSFDGAEWEIGIRGERQVNRHSAVLLAAPAYQLARMELEAMGSVRPLALLGEMTYAPVASLVLGFRRERVAHPLDGFGVLIPEAEQRRLLGVIFSSSLFPNRAPEGHVALTCYLGGMRSPSLARCDAATAVQIALADLRPVLGVEGQPLFVRHAAFERAIPQYEVGFGRFKTFMNRLEDELPGLHFAGHFRDGISLGDSILAGEAVARRIASSLRSPDHLNRPAPSMAS
ncbi:MAG TPA: protoporphyrinogen oxidase [Chthoniobacteraceae bacterium]|nr:protoporphyrinogen oxidase [Chthoniobacteraceae bacterium]